MTEIKKVHSVPCNKWNIDLKGKGHFLFFIICQKWKTSYMRYDHFLFGVRMNRTKYAIKFLEKLRDINDKAKRVSIDYVIEQDGFDLPSDDTRIRAINDLIDLGKVERKGKLYSC